MYSSMLLTHQLGRQMIFISAVSGFLTPILYIQGTLVATDINKKRLNLLRTAAAAQGVQGLIKIQNRDVQKYAADASAGQTDGQQQQQTYAAYAAGQALDDQQLPPQPQPQLQPQQQQQPKQQQFDRVLVDAPCSGLGVLAKRWICISSVRDIALMQYALGCQLDGPSFSCLI